MGRRQRGLGCDAVALGGQREAAGLQEHRDEDHRAMVVHNRAEKEAAAELEMQVKQHGGITEEGPGNWDMDAEGGQQSRGCSGACR